MSRFVSIYREIQTTLSSLVLILSDKELMEYVSDGSLLTVPLTDPTSEKKPLPRLEVLVGESILCVALTYRGSDELKQLKNLMHPHQAAIQREFHEAMIELPLSFETRLYKRGFKESDFVFVKKYVSARVNLELLSLIIGEAETIRSGGRHMIDGRSIYEAPATPVFYLLFKQFKLDEIELKEALAQMKRVIACVLSIKTQREVIHSSINKPAEQANNYRNFVDFLNRARGLNIISAEERRGLEKRWREIPGERDLIEEDLKRKLGELT